jgi:glutaconate CoA-transferase subunit A
LYLFIYEADPGNCQEKIEREDLIGNIMTKIISLSELISQISDGASIVIGGWGQIRKPMSVLREIVRSGKRDLTIMSLGGLDIDLLIGANAVKKIIYPFASIEGLPVTLGNFRRARQEGVIDFVDLSENMFISGFKAAAERLPFYPTRAGLGSDILEMNPHIKIVSSPYTKEILVAMYALEPDIALIHVNAADKYGNCQILGDPFFDYLFVKAAKKVFVSCEKIVDTESMNQKYEQVVIHPPWVTGVLEMPYGAHPGLCYPDYKVDQAHMTEYSKSTSDPQTFEIYLQKYVRGVTVNDKYLEAIGGPERLAALKV